MKYDVVAHAKKIHGLSESICAIARKIGKTKFADYFQNCAAESDDSLLSYLQAHSYIDEKRQFALNLLTFPEYSTITTTDPIAIEVISRVGRRRALEADKILQPLAASDPSLYDEYGLATSYLPDSELQDLSWDQFHGAHGTEGYVFGRIITRPLISPVSLPRSMPEILEEIRMCYAFGQMTAIHGLCRTLIETALTDVCMRTGFLTKAEVESDYFFKDFPPHKRINWVLRGSSRSEAFQLYASTSRVIHGSSKPKETSTIVRNSIDLVERLYLQHASQLRAD